MTETMDRVQTLSRWMKHACTAGLILIPLSIVLSWVFFESWAPALDIHRDIPYQLVHMGPVNYALACLVNLGFSAILLWGLYRLRQFFRLCSSGQTFSPAAGATLHSFARSLIVYTLATLPEDALLSLALTFTNPPGEKAVSISLGSNELSTIFMGGVFWVISWVIKESARLADENAQIV